MTHTISPAPPGVLPPRPLNLAEHRQRHGPVPWHVFAGEGSLIDTIEAAGLTGRGGAGFPTAAKMRAVARGGRKTVVLANGCEAEPLSGKDAALLSLAPHLVLDGLMLAAGALGADEARICLHHNASTHVSAALRERHDDPVRVEIVAVPARYVASEESALVNFINTGDARPTVTPPRPAERGVHGRPTLVLNVDTLAQIAVVARIGAAAYRATRTTLVTLTGAVRHPGVYEVPARTTVRHALERAGACVERPQAVLVGGYAGTWLAYRDAVNLPLNQEDLRAAGVSIGAATLHVLPASRCGITETAEILEYLAAESARQCGPCMFGLPAIAADFAELSRGHAPGGDLRRLRTRLRQITGRGACAHPDGAVRLAASAIRVFDADIAAHVSARACTAGTKGTVS
jgi:NADH:ubiquinone oxidoreductase subunit F (NADH-binding)